MRDNLFLIQDYLFQLRERGELDAILPDLLRAMGYQIVKLAFCGEVEHGVDIAAYSPDGATGILLLIQVKAGDIDQQLWDGGQNGIRATLNNLLDVPFKDLTQPRLQKAKKKVVLIHNGILRENIKAKFIGYIEDNYKDKYEFERWDLDILSNLFTDYLLNEKMLPLPDQMLLKRTLIFWDVPDYDFNDYKKLLEKILTPACRISKKQFERKFGFLRLLLAILINQCKVNSNLSIAIDLYEYTILQTWGWMYKNKLLSKIFITDFMHFTESYISLLLIRVQKLSPVLKIQNGLFKFGSEEKVEYPLRTFNVIGNLGFLTFILANLSNNEIEKSLLPDITELLECTIVNNPSSNRPLLDNNLIDIYFGLYGLLISRRYECAKNWIIAILNNLFIRKKYKQRIPELKNNIDAVIEFEATDERPLDYQDSSSTLIYFLLEFCLILKLKNEYEEFKQAFQDINLQVWYPPENLEEIIFFREIHEGDTETIQQLPQNFEDFYKDVKARNDFDKTKKYIKNSPPVLILLACKYYRTPIFPFFWREGNF